MQRRSHESFAIHRVGSRCLEGSKFDSGGGALQSLMGGFAIHRASSRYIEDFKLTVWAAPIQVAEFAHFGRQWRALL